MSDHDGAAAAGHPVTGPDIHHIRAGLDAIAQEIIAVGLPFGENLPNM